MYVRTIAIFAAVLVAGCKPHRAAEPPTPAGDQPVVIEEDLVLQVSNNNWSDVVLYMVHDGRRMRFTVVTAAHSAEFAIPPRWINANGTVQFVAHRIGGTDEYISPAVSVRLGRTVTLSLESNLVRSSVGVW